MKTISGLLEPWTGGVIFDGERLNLPGDRGSHRWCNFNHDVVHRGRMEPRKVARAGLVHVPEGRLLLPEMTIAKTLSVAHIAAGGRGDKAARLAQVHALFAGLIYAAFTVGLMESFVTVCFGLYRHPPCSSR